MPTTPRKPLDAPGTSHPEGAPSEVVFTGPPSLLRTTVSVENAAAERVAVRGAALHRTGHEPVQGAGTALIAAGATSHVPVTFRVDPGTPPGRYDAEVEVGGVRRAAVLRVEPHPSLVVSPRRLLAQVGLSTCQLTVTNDGNVPIPLAARVRARTDDGGPDPGPDVTLTVADPPTLAPGAWATVEGRLDVPTELDPTRRHLARLPVGTADLDVTILPRTASE